MNLSQIDTNKTYKPYFNEIVRVIDTGRFWFRNEFELTQGRRFRFNPYRVGTAVRQGYKGSGKTQTLAGAIAVTKTCRATEADRQAMEALELPSFDETTPATEVRDAVQVLGAKLWKLGYVVTLINTANLTD